MNKREKKEEKETTKEYDDIEMADFIETQEESLVEEVIPEAKTPEPV